MFLSKIILACHTDSNTNQILSRDVRKYTIISPFSMKEVYWEIKINNLSGPRQAKFWQKSGPRFVYFDLPIYFLHGPAAVQFCRNSFSILKFDWAQVLLSLCSNLEHFLSNAYFISTKEVNIHSVLTKYFWSVTFTFSYKIVFKWSEGKACER